jgi:dienelactone hydrolase
MNLYAYFAYLFKFMRYMNGLLRLFLWGGLLGIGFALTGCDGSGHDSNPSNTGVPAEVVQPLPLPGPYAVGCTNVTQDFSRLSETDDVKDYWEGMNHYVTDLLTDPDNTLIVSVNAPQNTNLYGAFAGDEIAFMVIVCYPTINDNPRPDYLLPTGEVLPHMQTGSDQPLFADASARYPVLVFSHGFGDSPISAEEYIMAMSTFASYGYVVIAPFHGDFRFSDFTDIEDIGDFITAALNLDGFTALQALRPLSMSAALTRVLEHPQWTGHLDDARIGGFGASMGGETLMLLGGAGLTTSYFNRGEYWEQVTYDRRIEAAVGYVPYFGRPILPAFGKDYDGLAKVTLPFLGISGTADTVAPISEVMAGMSRLTGTRGLVELSGLEHGFDVASTNDIFTWSLMFLDAELGNQASKAQFAAMKSVAGGGEDSVVIYYNGL